MPPAWQRDSHFTESLGGKVSPQSKMNFARIVSLSLFSAVLVCGQTESVTPVSAPQPPALTEGPEVPKLPEPADDQLAEPAQNNRERAPRVRMHRTRTTRTVFGENIVIRSNESIHDLVLIGGSADIQGEVEESVVAIGASVNLSGKIGQDLVIIGGEGKLSGQVEHDTVIVLGRAEISEKAQLERDAVLIGGPFNISQDSSIGGERIVVPFGDFLPQIEWLKKYVVSGPLLGRWLTFNLVWPWAVAGTFLAVYLAMLLVFPAAARAVYVSLEERPVTSLFTGLLTLILFAPLVFLLVVSIAGILVIPFLKIALILALLFGKVGVLCFLGRGVGKTTGAAALQAPLPAFILGGIILTLSYAVPLFGIFAWGVATVFGLGGAIVALSNTFKREEASVPSAPVLVSTVQPVSTGGFPGTDVPPAASAPIPGTAPNVAPGAMSAPPVANFSNLNPQDTVFLQRAGFWKRLLATILDLLLLIAAVVALPVIGPALFIPLAVVYFVAMWTWKGTTIGGLVLGHKIVRTNGRPVTFAVALVRSLTSLFSLLVVFLGFLWAGWDREKQTWHDKIAGTVVVRMPRGFSLL
jgi:uncharacterized RDD family membrane protein YckC